jgi:NAD(P)-dependent dehydrogenase (short-subunit alcohol dehydrogenase family)
MGPEQPLSGRNAVVAGGSRGIGRAVARALADAGAAVVVNGRDAGPVEEVVEEIRAAGGRACGCAGSVAGFDFAGRLIDACEDSFGPIDILVNCAGTSEPEGSSILDIAPDSWSALLDSHLTATFNTCRQAAPRMAARGRGAIVNTSSHASLGTFGGTGYPAGKGGVDSLTFAIAAELAEHGVRANAVRPGAKTRLSSGPAYERKIRDLVARGLLDERIATASLAPPAPEHVAPLYVFLAGDAACDVTGRIFSAAGGYVGVQERVDETLLAYRDAETDGPWSQIELAEKLRRALGSAREDRQSGVGS